MKSEPHFVVSSPEICLSDEIATDFVQASKVAKKRFEDLGRKYAVHVFIVSPCIEFQPAKENA
jgi:hypothetical protein